MKVGRRTGTCSTISHWSTYIRLRRLTMTRIQHAVPALGAFQGGTLAQSASTGRSAAAVQSISDIRAADFEHRLRSGVPDGVTWLDRLWNVCSTARVVVVESGRGDGGQVGASGADAGGAVSQRAGCRAVCRSIWWWADPADRHAGR